MTIDSQMHDATTTVGATSIATSSRTNSPPAMATVEKPKKFAGIDFKIWQQKVFFYLITLCLQRFTFEKAMEGPKGTSEQEHFMIFEAWKHSDFLCGNYILSGIQDDLYNLYSGTKTSKELWGALEQKYKMEDAGTKKFFVARFLEYRMVGNKSVVSQVQELQVIIHDILAEGLILNEAFQVAAMIKKLPPLWKDFKNYLKHKRMDMLVEDLIICHKSIDCHASKNGKKKDQANLAEFKKEMDDRCAILSKCNLVGNPREWWMVSGATRYVCANKELFSTFAPAQVEEKIYMTNSATAKVEGTRKVCLKMTYGKVLTLNNVLYVSELWKNLISISLLEKIDSNVYLFHEKLYLVKEKCM
ncbi:putative protein-like [Capsicum annuum]|nr:putative protein-like [Capsicum annuum]